MTNVTIADLRERISIRSYNTERNERGDIINVTEFERCRVWAKVYAMTAKISDDTPERTNKITHRITIRYRDDIKPDDEIIWRERKLRLLSPPYALESKREFVGIDCEEVVEDGTT